MRISRTEKTSSLLEDLEKMHLQWFADPDDSDVEFEPEDDDDDVEIVVLRDGEKPPEDDDEDEGEDDEVAKLRQQVADLSARASEPNQISEAISKGLSNIINKSGGDPSPEQQQPGESDEEFAKRFAEQLWKPGQEYNVLREAVVRIMAPYAQMTIGATVEQSKDILRMDSEKGPLFRRFEDEIEQRRSKLPPAQRNNPKVYRQLLDQVILDHPEVQQERIEQQIQEGVKNALLEMGIDPAVGGKKPKPTYTEGSTSRSSSGAKKKKRIHATEADIKLAEEKGVPVQVVLQAKYGRS